MAIDKAFTRKIKWFATTFLADIAKVAKNKRLCKNLEKLVLKKANNKMFLSY